MPAYIYRVDVRGNYVGQLWVNTFYWTVNKHNNVINPMDDIFRFLTDIGGPWGQYLSMMTTNCFVDFLRISRISPNPLLREGQTYTPSNTHGLNTGVGGPSQIALVLTRRAQNASRSFNGRVYIPGVPMVSYVGGVLNLASEAGVAALAFTSQVLTPFEGQAIGGIIPNLYTSGLIRRRAPFPTPDEYGFRPLFSFAPSSQPRAVHSRRPGVGR